MICIWYYNVETLDDPNLDATIFLPSNDGFAAFLEAANATPDDLLRFQGLGNILKYHVHLVAHNISEFQEGEVVDMINGVLQSMQAYTSGKLKIEGDIMKSQLIWKLFKLN